MFIEKARYPVRQGNNVRAHVDGVSAFGRIARAVDAAQESVYVTVAWIHNDFVWPDGRSFFDVLDAAAARGVDIRALFWRPDPSLSIDHSTCFPGTDKNREFLHSRDSRIGIRWDPGGEAVAHHQKSWIIDPGTPHASAFVGGMNINPAYVVEPGHADGGSHDLFVEVIGPAVADVFDNFVDRWNAVEKDHWGEAGTKSLQACPVPPECGEAQVQVQRTMKRTGERTILEQYLRAVSAAERYIYFENWYFEEISVVEAVHGALNRGVEVVALVTPGADGPSIRHSPDYASVLEQIDRLDLHPRFTMAGLSVDQSGHGRTPIPVHSKLLIVDDSFVTVGSCNCRWQSFKRHTELNVSVKDSKFAKRLRQMLFLEHLDIDTGHLQDVSAVQLFARIARSNRKRSSEWQGIVFSFPATDYGK